MVLRAFSGSLRLLFAPLGGLLGGFGGLQVALGGLFGFLLGPLGAIWGFLADRQSLLDVL